MNRPCQIHFHADAAPIYGDLPDRYKRYVCSLEIDDHEPVLSLYSQHAFLIDFTNGAILRTRVTGEKESDPVDFPMTSIAWIEWYYGTNVPPPLTPFVGRA